MAPERSTIAAAVPRIVPTAARIHARNAGRPRSLRLLRSAVARSRTMASGTA
jgi:hypothetical protein